MRKGTDRAAKAASAGARPERAEVARFVTETVDREGLVRIRDAWKALAGRAAEPNVFYDPDFALPAIEGLVAGAAIRALLVWCDDGPSGRRLTGVFPFIAKRRWGVPLSVGEAFIHPYAMSSAPLVDRQAVPETVAAFLDWLEGDTSPAAWLFRFLPEDGSLHAAFVDAAGLRKAALSRHGAYHRAVFDGGSVDERYLDVALGSKRRKEYRRLRRRLADHGEVTVTRAEAPDTVAAGIDAFLALEAAGWKGARGTAAALSPEIARMFKAIAAGLAASGQIRVDALTVDGKPVAVAVSCGEGTDWWFWKIAYDEDFATYSPGVQLVAEITQAAIAARDDETYDSCALPGIPMIERLWRQRRPYADVLIAPATLGGLRGMAGRLETWRRRMERLAKRALAAIGKR